MWGEYMNALTVIQLERSVREEELPRYFTLAVVDEALGEGGGEEPTPDVPVTGITVSGDGSSQLRVGATKQLVATLTPDNATDKTVLWALLNGSALTVDETGLCTGVRAGVAVVSATAHNGLSDTYNIIVVN